MENELAPHKLNSVNKLYNLLNPNGPISTFWVLGDVIIGVSLSEPHTDKYYVSRVYLHVYIYIYIYVLLSLLFHTFYHKSPSALILGILASFVNSKTVHKVLGKDTNHRSSMATTGTETTRGPTYSLTRAIWATPWQEGFICRCHCLHCHYSPLTVEVTRHVDRPIMATLMTLSARVQPQCRHILQSTWCARPVCMQQPYRPGMTCLKETLR